MNPINTIGMHENLKKGDIILSPLSYTDLTTDEVRPSLVLYHDFNDMQLIVAYITTQIEGPLGPFERLILKGTPTFVRAGLAYDSKLRVNWMMTVKRIHVYRKLGEADDDLRAWVNQTVPVCLHI
jgi:mRNA interferase MazF